MTLIKSISGIRGTIGGRTGDTLNPLDIVKFTTAYATFIGQQSPLTTHHLRSSLAAMAVSLVLWFATSLWVPSWAWAMMS